MEPFDLKEEFRALLKASGWSQAEASRQLCMTPSALSQIVRENSPVKPSQVTLRLFKLLLLRENPNVLSAITDSSSEHSNKWETDLIESLRRFPPSTRQEILMTFHTILKGWAKSRPFSTPSGKRHYH